MAVFQMPGVRDELKLTDAQKERFKDLDKGHERSTARIKRDFETAKKELGEPHDRQAELPLFQSRNAAFATENAEFEAAARKILDRRQLTRLEQIWAQAEGPMAFSRPEFRDRLYLAPEQIQEIGNIRREGSHQLEEASVVPRDVMPDARTTSQEQRLKIMEGKAYKNTIKGVEKKARQIRGSTMQAIAKVLTKGQRERFQKLIGEPFDFQKAANAAQAKPPEAPAEPKAP
jgi:Spy/CpxP family protein refolding chaperone